MEIGVKVNTMDILNLLKRFRGLDPEISAQEIALFLKIADNKDISLTALADDLKISQSSVSRNIMKLSEINRHRTEGLGLVETFENPENRREKLVRLTAKGRQFFKNLN